ELRDGTRGRQAHIPDGIVRTAEGRVAIEVELTPKTEERVRDILWRLTAAYDRVIYYATPRAAAVVRKAGRHHLDDKLVIRSYPLTDAAAGIPHTPAVSLRNTAVASTPALDTASVADRLEVAPAAVPVTTAEPAEAARGVDGDGHQPGLLEQHALALADAQATALDGVEDAWRAAGHALAGLGRRRRRGR